MSNDNVFERIFKLWAMICKMILDGKRDPEVVATSLQAIVDGTVSSSANRWRTDSLGVIYFTLISTGETGPQWADWYKANGYDLGSEAEFMIRSAAFQPSKAGTVYEIAVLPGKLWGDAERITSTIRAECDRRGLKHGKEMNPEIACLIRRTFSDEEIEAMGLTWIISLHDPIIDSDGYPSLLGASRSCGYRRLDACSGLPGFRWSRADGFASVVSQVSAQVLGS